MAEATASTEAHILNFVKQIAEEQNFKTFEIEITPVFTNGANYTSNLYRVKITGEGRSLDLFSKVAALHENCRDPSKWDPFVTEALFYTDLLKTYRGLEEKHGVDVQDKFKCPVFYGAESTYLRELLVLEDLTTRGFTMADRLQSTDWPYAAATIADLAKFHALSVVFRHESPNKFNTTTKDFPVDSFLGNTAVEGMFKRGLQSALAVIPDESKEKLSSYFRDRDVLLWFTELGRSGNCKVITHGDFKPVNIMYTVLNDGSKEAMPVDFQNLTVGSPIIDLLYFIFTSTDGTFRARYYQKIIDHYYSNFSDTLARLGLNVEHVFPRDVFDAELKEKLPYGLLMAVTFLPVFLVSTEDAPVIGDDFSTKSAVKGTGDLYAQRINDVIRDYITWGVLGNSPSAEDSLQKDGSNEVYPVDYQTIHFGSPVIDLIHFIITATDGAFRAAQYQDLIEHYYSELGVALKRFGLKVKQKFPRNKFDLELKEKLPFGLMMSIALLPILLVPEDKAPTFGDDFSSIVVSGTGDLYARRINDMVHDCIKWGIL